MAIKLEGGGGGKALMGWPLVEDFFGGFSNSLVNINTNAYTVMFKLCSDGTGKMVRTAFIHVVASLKYN